MAYNDSDDSGVILVASQIASLLFTSLHREVSLAARCQGFLRYQAIRGQEDRLGHCTSAKFTCLPELFELADGLCIQRLQLSRLQVIFLIVLHDGVVLPLQLLGIQLYRRLD